jgi:hypothetical protein
MPDIGSTRLLIGTVARIAHSVVLPNRERQSHAEAVITALSLIELKGYLTVKEKLAHF